MEVYLSRNHQTCLHLFPLSTGKFQDVFNQPNGPGGRSPRLVIERFISPLEELDRSLKGMTLRSLSDVSQLNELVEGVERMGERDRQILSGALRAEHVKCLADVYRTVQNISDYELIGGIFTPDGYVQRKKDLPKPERDAVICLTLATAEQSDTLLLPASEKQIEDAERTLGDLDRAVIATVEFKPPYLKNLIPTDHITMKEAQALADCLQGMAKEENEMLKFCSALAVEEPGTFSEALTIAMDIDDYERVPEDMDEYGKQVLRRIGADDELIDTIDGYMDFARLGADSLGEDGVRRTEFGLVRRLSKPFPTEEIGQVMS